MLLSFIPDDEQWNDMIIACSSLASKWHHLSGYLGLSLKTIRAIKENNANDAVACLNDALMQWICQDFNTVKYGLPSWKTLLRAVNRVDQALFEKLVKDHQIQSMCITMST